MSEFDFDVVSEARPTPRRNPPQPVPPKPVPTPVAQEHPAATGRTG